MCDSRQQSEKKEEEEEAGRKCNSMQVFDRLEKYSCSSTLFVSVSRCGGRWPLQALHCSLPKRNSVLKQTKCKRNI